MAESLEQPSHEFFFQILLGMKVENL